MRMKFSKWAKWDEREIALKMHGKKTLSGKDLLKYRGIYALAISEKTDMTGKDFKWEKDIVYFGMTNSIKGFAGRLKQFDNTLRKKRGGGHGGAARFISKNASKKARELLAKKLFVSVSPFFSSKPGQKPETPSDLRVMGLVVKAEYDAWATYLEKHKALPEYNNKERSPKR